MMWICVLLFIVVCMMFIDGVGLLFMCLSVFYMMFLCEFCFIECGIELNIGFGV